MTASTTTRRRRPRSSALAVALVFALALIPWPAGASDDPLFPSQWALGQIQAPAAWTSTTGTGIRIGIVDTGIDLAHEDLAAKVVASTSCIGAGGDPTRCAGSAQDDHGHGTHVAGIAAALGGNAKGVAGVAPGAELVVAKALDADGSGTTEDINAGVKWVVDQGARVVNLSLGGNFLITSLLGTPLQEGIDYAWSKGAVPVIASGNTNLLGLGIGSSEYGELPAIVVGATGPEGVASYSSPTGNAQWAVLAPGGAGTANADDNILSTFWVAGKANEYKALAGTSMAAPHVAGAVSLLLATGATPQAAVNRILETADQAVSCGPSSPTCRGRLDVAAAVGVAAARDERPPSAPPQRGLLGPIFSR